MLANSSLSLFHRVRSPAKPLIKEVACSMRLRVDLHIKKKTQRKMYEFVNAYLVTMASQYSIYMYVCMEDEIKLFGYLTWRFLQ